VRPWLRFDQVTGIRGGRVLFERLSLELGSGSAALVTGPNGVGKSSLLRIAAGLLRPAAGRVEAFGCALADEHDALDERQRLGEALTFWARLDGRDPSAAMEMMGIAHLASVPVRMLSTGQRKRAVLARVIASGEPLWLLDEPANGLDADGQVRLAEAVAEYRRGGGAVLAASHLPLGLDDAQAIPLG
jgi:heme exporter protein A